ncbi:hypothetical protein AX14_009892 [Amanita brunnescens Koide BX004]|nr:hypothetical protein AX14_009892 [Amanita brunnescens Koide BX004]
MANGLPPKDLTGYVWKTSNAYFAYGGFSEVYQGIYQDQYRRQHPVAIKVITVRDSRGPRETEKNRETLFRRLNREAGLWHALKHPNIQEFLGVVHNMGSFFALVSPYRAEGNVSGHLQRHPQSSRLHLILGVAKATEYLHINNVIHGDIKGANILVADDGTPLLSDFGRSKIINQRGFTTSMAGSLRYLAPEIIWDGQSGESDESFLPALTKESDVYAFSMTGVEILTGRPPYPNIRNDNRITIGVPEGLRPRMEEYQLSARHAVIWGILQLCWHQTPTRRLTMLTVVQQLYNTR